MKAVFLFLIIPVNNVFFVVFNKIAVSGGNGINFALK